MFTAITSDDRLLFDADETAGVSGCVRSRGCCAPPLLDVKHARPRAPKYIYIYIPNVCTRAWYGRAIYTRARTSHGGTRVSRRRKGWAQVSRVYGMGTGVRRNRLNRYRVRRWKRSSSFVVYVLLYKPFTIVR